MRSRTAGTARGEATHWDSSLWFLGCVATAAALALFGLGDKGLSLDEAASAVLALHGPETWFADHNMALYYVLLAGWIRCFGWSEFALRSLSVACFLAALPPMAAVARRALGEQGARSALLLYVTNPLLLQFAQEARGYMLEVWLLLVAAWALLCLLEQPHWGLAVLHGTALGLALYAHLFAAWLGLVHGSCALGIWRAPNTPRLQLAAALALSACFAAPLLISAAYSGSEQIAWLYPPSAAAIWASLTAFAGSGVLAYTELVLMGAFAVASLAPPDRAETRARVLVLLWLALPLIGSWLFSLWIRPIAHPKYLIIVLPAWLIASAGGLELTARRGLPWLHAAVLLGLLIACALRLHFWYADAQKERWREAVQLIAASMQAQDGLVLDVLDASAFDYYIMRSGAADRWPRALFPERSWAFPSDAERVPAPEELEAALRATPRVWVVRNRSQRTAAELPLEQNHRLVWQATLEPNDGDDRSLFADSRGRVIELQLYAR